MEYLLVPPKDVLDSCYTRHYFEKVRAFAMDDHHHAKVRGRTERKIFLRLAKDLLDCVVSSNTRGGECHSIVGDHQQQSKDPLPGIHNSLSSPTLFDWYFQQRQIIL